MASPDCVAHRIKKRNTIPWCALCWEFWDIEHEYMEELVELRSEKAELIGKIVETPDEMLWRVANHVSKAELQFGDRDAVYWAKKFYNIMANLEFLPNSPCLANAGKPNGQLSACFVLPIEDSMECIFDAVKNAALIHKTGGGTGFDFSRLRPKGSVVKSTGQTASGPVAFMGVFDAATRAIKQGGMRRGANMGILRVDHPDVIEFINSKRGDGGIGNFNISVAITDDFMGALNGDIATIATSEACYIWKEICQAASETGDPGVVFIDRRSEEH